MAQVTVYAIRFERGEIYVGMSKDLGRRLQEHERRQSASTKRFEGAWNVSSIAHPDTPSQFTFLLDANGHGKEPLDHFRIRCGVQRRFVGPE